MTAGTPTLQESATDRAIPALELAEWADRFGLVAGITTRDAGFNLGLLTPDPAADVIARWRSFAGAMAPDFVAIAVGLQVHGCTIAHHRDVPPGWTVRDGVDGHATRDRGVLCCVSVADCIPVYLAHPASGTVALLHAGWRGVAAGVLEAGIAAVRAVGSGAPTEFVMHCGVGICGDCYEVGPEVLAAVTGEAALRPARLDLRRILAARARAAGLREVTLSSWCAGHHADRFFSHRRSGGADGRMFAYLGQPIA